MTGVGAADLETLWRTLPTPAGVLLEAERVGSWPGGDVLVAVDNADRRHLLIEVPPDVRPPRLARVRGLTIDVRRMRVQTSESTWIDIAPTGEGTDAAFAALCAEAISVVSGAAAADADMVFATFDRWRRFWAMSAGKLGPEQQLGLFGELWALLEWVGVVNAASVTSWRGPLGGRHDFVSPTVSVEVKTTVSIHGPAVHVVHGLDQLADPATGVLYLLSLTVARDPLGAHSLNELVSRARAAATLSGERTSDLLDERLAAAGWNAADRDEYDDPISVVGGTLYRVDASFPRLTRSGFPGGLRPEITDVTYLLDANALLPWVVSTDPGSNAALNALRS